MASSRQSKYNKPTQDARNGHHGSPSTLTTASESTSDTDPERRPSHNALNSTRRRLRYDRPGIFGRSTQLVTAFCALLVTLSFFGSVSVPFRESPYDNLDLKENSMDLPSEEENIINMMQIPDVKRKPKKKKSRKSNGKPTTYTPKLKFKSLVHTKSNTETKPRVVYMEEPVLFKPLSRLLDDDPMMHAPKGKEAAVQDHMKPEPPVDCVPMSKWQTEQFPTCNTLHEMDLKRGVDVAHSRKDLPELDLLGEGWFRSTWKWASPRDKHMVLKTLRFEREFYDEFYELHRRDAVAMERLSHSPFVMDIYGFCGQSAINEIADYPNGLNSLEKFDRQLRSKTGRDINFLKLQLTSSLAVAVAHVHEIDDRPSMVHYDLNPRNVAIVASGKPKLNDFNTAEFLHINVKTNETCGFKSRLHEPWWRAPEEVTKGNSNKLIEKVDVFALGNVMYHTLTTHSPRGKMQPERMNHIRAEVLAGKLPELLDEYKRKTDPMTKAMVKAIKMCFEFSPEKRTSARKVADLLMDALIKARETMPGKSGKPR